jgi:hypothetical protein
VRDDGHSNLLVADGFNNLSGDGPVRRLGAMTKRHLHRRKRREGILQRRRLAKGA